MQQLSGDLIRHKLSTRYIGQNVIFIRQIGSTNTELKQLARKGAPEGLLYITDEQIVGRGRLERSWVAPPGSSLLMSLLFKPAEYLYPTQAQLLTMICALALSDAIKMVTELSPGVKWPNDLVWEDGKKLAGILTESEIQGDALNWVVVGIGLNVNIDFSSYTSESPDRPGKANTGHAPLAQIATSLSMILGRDTDELRLPILQRYLENVEQYYDALKRDWSPRKAWENRLVGLGQTVTVTDVNQEQRYQGQIVGVDENGSLRLQRADGSIVTILAGDVTLKP